MNGAVVPAAVTARWLLDRRPLTWLGVLNLHHIEFEDVNDFERLLSACADARVEVVFTAHDLTAMSRPSPSYGSGSGSSPLRVQPEASVDEFWGGETPG